MPYPFAALPHEAFTRLPEPADVAALEAVAAAAYGVADPAMVVAAPGTQVLISLLPHVLPQREVAVVGPTYAEHAAAWRGAGCGVREVAALPDGGAAVLCNPNNPDGRVLPPAALRTERPLLVVDEAFADFEPGVSVAGSVGAPGLLVLRSFGKAYGLAGVRLGFALAAPAAAVAIRRALGPWAVSGAAVAIGRQALADRGWAAAAAARLAVDAGRLDALLVRAGAAIVGGTRLFRLARFADADAAADRLARAGIVVRRFTGRPGLVRFGIPGPGEWARLEAAL